ncbi:hypothetical protein BJX63DRAFT_402346 [Aspergillus granulosus]|uniref:Uncharacterized protein n=1 Tax=Aspergillus granulosus TaxID=176169 RepID=A0ABR4H4F4_9EURO
MKFTATWPWLFLVSSRLFTGAIARECVLDTPLRGYWSSVDDIYKEVDGCTTIISSDIDISPVYDRLYLPDVVNITGTIVVQHWRENMGYPIVPAIEMPRLEHLGGLDISNATALQNVTMPTLKELPGKLYIESSSTFVALDFRSLEHANSIRLGAQFKGINFDSLQTVDNDFIIDTPSRTSGRLDPEDALWLSLNSLVSVGYFELYQVLSTLDVSNLVTAGPPTNPGDSGLSTSSGARFHLNNVTQPFDLNLTRLQSVDKDLYIGGDLASLSIPALRNTNATILIEASEPLSIDLPIESADYIYLQGRITSVHLPNISPNTSITLVSTYECDPHEPLANITCPVPSAALSQGAKAGMGVGIAVGVVLVAIAIFFCCRLSRKHSSEALGTDLADLPTYGHGDTGSNRVPVPVQVTDRPNTPPPPPYSARPS